MEEQPARLADKGRHGRPRYRHPGTTSSHSLGRWFLEGGDLWQFGANSHLWHAYEVAHKEELPDFNIPHADKIEWMIETAGWALEPVSPDYSSEPPRPGYSYSIGFPQAFNFPEVVIFGLTPVAIRGLLDLIVDQLRGGVEIPIGTPLVGLLDNDLRCIFAEVDLAVHGNLFQTAERWHQGRDFRMVQLAWPDRSGWLPYESGFDTGLRLAQPMLGHIDMS